MSERAAMMGRLMIVGCEISGIDLDNEAGV